eukprot:3621686-Rhodomonas_salina.1
MNGFYFVTDYANSSTDFDPVSQTGGFSPRTLKARADGGLWRCGPGQIRGAWLDGRADVGPSGVFLLPHPGQRKPETARRQVQDAQASGLQRQVQHGTAVGVGAVDDRSGAGHVCVRGALAVSAQQGITEMAA